MNCRRSITLSSNQNLSATPSVSPVASGGTFQGSGFSGSDKTWTRTLRVSDDDLKGTHTWQNLIAFNLAGISASSTCEQYTLGGFVFRTLTIAAWPNREGSIGTQVSDTSKLECTNLSKGASGSLNYTYDPDTSDEIDKYTITQPTGIANPTGNLWYNKDLANAVSNTGGSQQIELEETV